MKELHEASPFKIGTSDFILQSVETNDVKNQAPVNSFQTSSNDIEIDDSILNIESSNSTRQNMSDFNIDCNYSNSGLHSHSQSNSSIPKRNDISYNTKEAILNMHRQFQVKQDDLHLHSITPASSLNSDMYSSVESVDITPILTEIKTSFQSRESVSLNYDSLLANIQTDEISEIEWNEKRTSRIELSYEPILEETDSQIGSQEECRVGPSFALGNDSASRSGPAISYFVSLLPEESNEVSSLMWQSKEAIKHARLAGITLDSIAEDGTSDDEGSLHILENRRVFLKENASKNRFTATNPSRQLIKSFVKIPPKEIDTTDLYMSTILESDRSIGQSSGSEFPVFPSVLGPMTRKLVFCDAQDDEDDARIMSVTTCSGFNTAPSIKFSNTDKSHGYSDTNTKLLAGLFDIAVASSLVNNQAVWLSCGFEHCAVVTNSGLVMTWGFGASGALGHGNTLSYSEPKIVDELASQCVAYIECGAYHNAAVTVDGEVFTWGRGDVNQLGIKFSQLVKDDMGYFALYPQQVSDLADVKIKSLACGEAHTIALDIHGHAHAFGWAEDGQLGIPESQKTNSVMSTGIQKISGISNIHKVSCGSIFSVFLTVNGDVFICGNGEQGQLGMGNAITGITIPTKLDLDEKIIDIICGESHAIALGKSGKLYGWGQGIAGEFSDASEQFPAGSEIICFSPRILQEVDTLHHYLFKAVPKAKENDQAFANDLYAKLSELENMKFDSD